MSVIDRIRSKDKYFAKRFSLATTAQNFDVDSNFSLFKSEYKGASTNFSASRGSGEGERHNVYIYPDSSPVWIRLNSTGNDLILAPADQWLELLNVKVSNVFLTNGGTGTAAQIQDIQAVADSSGSLGGKYFYLYGLDAVQGEIKFGVWIDVDNGSTQPTDATVQKWIEVDISADDGANTVASAVDTAIEAATFLDGSTDAFGSSVTTDTVTVTAANSGALDAAEDVDTGFTFSAPSTPGAGTATTITIMVV